MSASRAVARSGDDSDHAMTGLDTSPDRHAGLIVNVGGLGGVRLVRAIARNPETSIYQTDHPGVVVKIFDLYCDKPDEIGYGPYTNFQAELANFEEILRLEDLREFVPAYFGANIDYNAKYAFIAMEYLEGQNLRHWAEEAAATGYDPEALDNLRRATHEVLAILDGFHRHGLIMIDFKPDNVIRLSNSNVKLVDLGAFFTPRHLTNLGSFLYTATPDHAEVLIDASNLQAGIAPTVASDVFSAGVALFEMATGKTRLALSPATADEMLATPAIYRFRDTQIADVWRAFPHLKDALPLVRTQLVERNLLFSEVWHLLKSYLAAKVPDWDSLPPEQHDQIILSAGTTFILEQLPAPLAWLAGAIARATVFRSLRARDLRELIVLLSNPASEEAQTDVTEHSCLVRHLRQLGLEPAFAMHLNTWELRHNRQSGHWTVAAPFVARELGENARFIFVRRDHTDEDGHTYWTAVDESEAARAPGAAASIAKLCNDHRAWLC